MSRCLLLLALFGSQPLGAGEPAPKPLLKLADSLGTTDYIHAANFLAFSRGSDLLVTGSGETIRIWDTKKNTALATIRRPPLNSTRRSLGGLVTYAALFGADKFLLACDYLGPYCWDVTNNRPLFSNKPALSIIKATAIMITPDEKAFWVGDKSGTLSLYSTVDGGPVAGPLKNADAIESLAISPDGLVVAAGLNNGRIVLWNTKTGKQAHAVEAHDGAVRLLQFAEKGSVLVSAGQDAQVHIWDAAEMRKKTSLNAPEGYFGLSALAVSPNGKLLALCPTKAGITIWDIAEQKKIRDLAVYSLIFVDVSFSRDGETLAAAGSASAVCLWETKTGTLLNPRVGHYSGVSAAVITNDAKKVVSVGGDGQALCWTKGMPKPQKFTRFDSPLRDMPISLRSSTLAIGAGQRLIELWDLKKKEKMLSIHCADLVAQRIDLSPDGKKLAVTGFKYLDDAALKHGLDAGGLDFNRYSILIYDTSSGKLLRRGELKAKLGSVPRFAPDSSTLLLREADRVSLWDSSTGTTIKEAQAPSDRTRLAAFSPDGAWFVAGNISGQLTFWDAKTCTRIRSIGKKLPPTFFRSVAVAPDGKFIAAGESDGIISLWDPAGNELFRIKHHEGAVTCLAFSPDGNFLVSGSADTTLAVWEVKKE